MKIDILTLFPEVFSSVLDTSIIGRAKEKGIIELNYINIREYTLDKHNRVDDYPYGGGAGMLLKTQPLFYAYEDILSKSEKRPKTMYMSPRGKVFNQDIAKELAKEEHIVLICGHYEGIDQRVIDEICDFELSIGDFVLTGGELAAMIVTDAVSRLVPGVLSSDVSFKDESHYNGLLEYPQYTRPAIFHNRKVPEILISGNQKEIDKFRQEKSVELTKKIRPDLFALSEIEYKPEISELITPDVKFKLEIVCDDKTQKDKISSMLKLQLEKNNIAKNISCDDYKAKAIIDCGGKGEYLKENVPVFLCGYLSAFEPVNINFDFEYDYMPEKSILSAVEISEEIYKFLMSVKLEKNILEKITNQNYEEVEFEGGIPYELYENHIEKLKEYNNCDIFIVKHKKDLLSGYITLVCDEQGINLIEGKAFDIKSKKYGRLSIICAHGLGTYFNEIIVKKNILKKFKGINGKFGEIILNSAKLYHKEIFIPESEKEKYKKEHPYYTENLEFFV